MTKSLPSTSLLARSGVRVALTVALALLAVGYGSDGGESPTASATTSPSPATDPRTHTSNTVPPTTDASLEPSSALPFRDDFDDDRHGWGGPFQRMEDGAYVWELPPGQRDARSPDTLIAVEDEIEHVSIATSFTALGTDTVAIECAYEEIGGSSRWYSLELGTAGAVIRRRPLGDTRAETLATDTTVVLTEAPTTLNATCAPAGMEYRLTFTVDGVTVFDVVDTEPFGRAGAPNLAVQAAPADVAEHSFVRFDYVEVVAAALST